MLLPGDGPSNGDVWAKSRADYVTFLCKSTKPAQMRFHLLQRGKTAGTYQTGFAANPGDWQRVILPIQSFDLKSFAKVAGLGFRLASADKDARVSVRDIAVGAMPYTEDSWKSTRHTISLKGDWRFATETGTQGTDQKWFADVGRGTSLRSFRVRRPAAGFALHVAR